jgi:hypothetical protein
MASSHVTDEDIPPLPQNKTAVQVLADFMHYLHQCTKKYIKEAHANGENMLRSVEHTTEFVLSHPNGWEGSQQTQIRNAAVMAGLVPDTPEGRTKIHLVTEGEASLHYCLGSGLAADGFQVRLMLGILDERLIEISGRPGGGYCRRWWRNDRCQRISHDHSTVFRRDCTCRV